MLPDMLLALTHHGGIRLAEVGFALVAVAGALLALGGMTPARRSANALAGLALAVGGVLVIVAAHWGHFG
jgi:hypothetical protein